MATSAKIVMDNKNELCLLHTDIRELADDVYGMTISLYKHKGEKAELLGQVSLKSLNELDSVLWYATDDKIMLALVDGLETDEERYQDWSISQVQEFSDYGITIYELEEDGFQSVDKIYYNEKIEVDDAYLDIMALGFNTYGTMNLYKSKWIIGTQSMDVNYNSVLGYNLELGKDKEIINSVYTGDLFNDIVEDMLEVELKERDDIVDFYVEKSDLDKVANAYQQSEIAYLGIDTFIEDGVKYKVSRVVQEEYSDFGMYFKGDDELYVTANYLYEFNEDVLQASVVHGYPLDVVNYLGVLEVNDRDSSKHTLDLEEGVICYGERKGATPLENIILPTSIMSIETVTMMEWDELNEDYSDYSTIFNVEKNSVAYEYVHSNFLRYRESGAKEVTINPDKDALLAYMKIFEEKQGGKLELFYDNKNNLCMLAGFADSPGLDQSNPNSITPLSYYIYTYKNGKVEEFQTNTSDAFSDVYIDKNSSAIILQTYWFRYQYTKYLRVIDNEVTTLVSGVNLIQFELQYVEPEEEEYKLTIGDDVINYKTYAEYLNALKEIREKNGMKSEDECIEVKEVYGSVREYHDKYIEVLLEKIKEEVSNKETSDKEASSEGTSNKETSDKEVTSEGTSNKETSNEEEANNEISKAQVKIKEITASSVDKETRANGTVDVYSTENMLDSNNNTTWAEDRDNHSGTSFINIELQEKAIISGVKISAGYFKTSELYYKNNRPKTLIISFDNGEEIEYTLKDDSFEIVQDIKFEKPQTSKNIKIIIKNVYLGSHYNDTCISEIEVY